MLPPITRLGGGPHRPRRGTAVVALDRRSSPRACRRRTTSRPRWGQRPPSESRARSRPRRPSRTGEFIVGAERALLERLADLTATSPRPPRATSVRSSPRDGSLDDRQRHDAGRPWRRHRRPRERRIGGCTAARRRRSTSRVTSTSSPPRRWRSSRPARSRSSTCRPRSRCSRPGASDHRLRRRRAARLLQRDLGPPPRAPRRHAGRRRRGDRGALVDPGRRRDTHVQPPPPALAIDAAEIDAWIEGALADAASRDVRGGAVTPHLLSWLARASVAAPCA